MNADIWFEPAVVLEVLGAELSLSPSILAHSEGAGGCRTGNKVPRFTGVFRDDKGAS